MENAVPLYNIKSWYKFHRIIYHQNEKLQYDIDREAAKISALSSGKIHKHKYLTGKDILPSNQQQIIKHAKFTYSPLGKAFEKKQTKTIEDQGKKQIDILKSLKPKAMESGSNNKSTITQEIYNKILEERIDEILEMRDKIKFKSLTYYFKGTTSSTNFLGFGGPMYTYEKLKNGETTLKQVEKE